MMGCWFWLNQGDSKTQHDIQIKKKLMKKKYIQKWLLDWYVHILKKIKSLKTEGKKKLTAKNNKLTSEYTLSIDMDIWTS